MPCCEGALRGYWAASRCGKAHAGVHRAVRRRGLPPGVREANGEVYCVCGPCADMCFRQPRPYIRGRPGSGAPAPSAGAQACSHAGRVSRLRMTKQTPHTYTHSHAHTYTPPASRDVVTARRPIEGWGRGIELPPPWCASRRAGPRLRATSRGAAGGVCGGVVGLHVRRFARAEGSEGSARPRR